MIIRLDASGLKNANCIRRLLWHVVEGYKGKDNSIILFYGTCFHYFAEQLERSGDANATMFDTQKKFSLGYKECSVPKGKDYLELGHLTRTCIRYMQAKQNLEDYTKREVLKDHMGMPLSEVKFSMPLCKIGEYEFLLQGTIDLITRIRNGCLLLEDFKTTSKDPTYYFIGARARVQPKTYILALQKMAQMNDDNMFAALLRKYSKVGMRINGVFYGSKKETEFESSDIFFYEPSELAEYETWLMQLCARLASTIDAYRSAGGVLPPPEGTYIDACDYCAFLMVCNAAASVGLQGCQSMLKSHFMQREYKPLEFGGGQSNE